MTGNLDPSEHVHRFAIHDVQLNQGGAAHAVNEQQHFVAFLKGQVIDDRGQKHLGHFYSRIEPSCVRAQVHRGCRC